MAIAIGLLKTLLELARSKKSGVLDVEGAGARVRLFVEDGVIVFADEGTIRETLGRILVREKVITEAQYDAALERMATLRKQGNKKRLGEILIEQKALTTAQLDAALGAQVKQKVVRALGGSSSKYKFVESHGPIEVSKRLPTPVEPLVVEALRLAPEEQVEELLDLALSRYPELRGDGTAGGGPARAEVLKRLDAFALPPPERALALALDGTRTSAEILGGTSGVRAAVVLAALLLTDCLDLHGAPRTPRRPPAGGKPRAIRRAPKPPPAAARAARSVRPPAPDEERHVREVAARLKAAKEAKSSLSIPASPATPDTPETPEPPVARLVAEKAFQAGKAFIRANDIEQARIEFLRAATLFPAMEYELWAAWTAMRADKENEARYVPDLRALAERALAQDPSLGFAYFVLGHLALRVRDATRARELFAKARALDPATSDDARDVRLRATEPKSEPPEQASTHETNEAKETSAPRAPEPEPVAPTPPPRARGRRRTVAIVVVAVAASAVALAWASRPNGSMRPTHDAGAIFPNVGR